jgi:hypothetical protein
MVAVLLLPVLMALVTVKLVAVFKPSRLPVLPAVIVPVPNASARVTSTPPAEFRFNPPEKLLLPDNTTRLAPVCVTAAAPARFALTVLVLLLAKMKLLAELNVPEPVITPLVTVRSLMVLDDVPTANVPPFITTEFVPKVPLAPKAIVPRVNLVTPL